MRLQTPPPPSPPSLARPRIPTTVCYHLFTLADLSADTSDRQIGVNCRGLLYEPVQCLHSLTCYAENRRPTNHCNGSRGHRAVVSLQYFIGSQLLTLPARSTTQQICVTLEGYSLEFKHPPSIAESWTQNSYNCPYHAVVKIPRNIPGSGS